ncbi:putative inactive receptor kinase At5g10020, partial [Apium graveolens]|uniref:putative inactive receptor kinase At5g10020 n=1 Tax=Apium graveolens TaxID=4045 RepID=UPI003D7A2A4E
PVNSSFPLYLLLLLFSLISTSLSTTSSELQSLLEFKKGVKTDPLNKLSTWTTQNPNSDPNDAVCSSFYGIICESNSNSPGSVTGIVLDRLGLDGDLRFSTLSGLKSLKNLSLAGNSLTGRLVPTLGLITSLQHLDLSGNLFYGPIPGKLNDLWDLRYLNLSRNKFVGGFPSGIERLQQLKVLDLSENGLWGDVKEFFNGLRNVEHVDLSSNEFFGSVLVDAGNISGWANIVEYLDLSSNKLSGGFLSRDVVGLFRKLRVLDLGDNQLTGELPSFGDLPNLQVLRLGNNQLYGSIPGELLGSSVPVKELDLSRNEFSGSIPNISSTTLSALNLSANVLSGLLPPRVGSCQIVDLSRNSLSDDISVVQNWEANLEVLDLSSNKLSGSVPSFTSQSQRLAMLNLRNNSLVGSLPTALGTYPRLSVVDLSVNKLDGFIPRSLLTSVALMSLNISGNQLTGPLPLQGSHTSELLVLPSYPLIESLDLSDNSLSGPLQTEIGNLGRLKLLSLAKNKLSGELPDELKKLVDLEYLDLSNNNFSGKIPDKLPLKLKGFNVSYNNLSGVVPGNLKSFPDTSFHPGNVWLIFPEGSQSVGGAPVQAGGVPGQAGGGKNHKSKSNIRVAIIVASVVAAVMVAFILLAYYRVQLQDFRVRGGFSSQTAGRDVKVGKFSRPPPNSLSFSNDLLLASNSRSLSGKKEFVTEIVEPVLPAGKAATSASTNLNLLDSYPETSGRKSSSGSPRFVEAIEQSVTLDVYSPDRLAGELFFLDNTLAFTAEELSRAPAEVLGRSSHGTLYKATLGSGLMLTVKWLRVGLVKHKKEFAKEVKRVGSIRHPNVVPLRAYYWGPREQERLVLADYVDGDSVALHLYESTPRRHSLLSLSQRFKVAVDVARSLVFLHEKGMPHGNLKPTNVILAGSDYDARLTDYGLHRLMTPAGIAEQILTLGALGYRAPELATMSKPVPTFKADVYAYGVMLMELLTRRSAGDIISGQLGAVDLTDWVRMCDQEGRGMDCIDRDISRGEEHTQAMDELLSISVRCILPVNERPNMRQVYEEICSISA